MIIELTEFYKQNPVAVNLTMITHMERAYEPYFNPMKDAIDQREVTEIHFPTTKIRVVEKYEGIWNRMVQNGVKVVSELKR